MRILEVEVEAEGEGAGTGPDGAVDTGFRGGFGVHAAVASEDEDILDCEGETDVRIKVPDRTEGVTEIDVIQTEEGGVLDEVVRVPLLGAVRLGESGLRHKQGLVRETAGVHVDAGCGVG